MTQGLVRYHQTGNFHFLTFSCYRFGARIAVDKSPIFGSLTNRGTCSGMTLSAMRKRPERPFRQARYYDFTVRSSEKTTEKLRYIHRNPVVRGLVSKPEAWPWSRFRSHLTGERGTVEIESVWTAAARGYVLPKGFGVERAESRDLWFPGLRSETLGHPRLWGSWYIQT